MNNNETMCYITYAVPASMLPKFPFGEISVPVTIQQGAAEETKEIYPPGFMPEWFLRGSFPEDDIED